jgi:hypothetical protein
VPDHSETFEFDESSVTLTVPADAEFAELEGLEDGRRHLTWSAAPGAFFMISAGPDDGYTAAGTVAGEGLQVDSDAPAPLAGADARRVAFHITRRRPRTLEAGVGAVPERAVRELSDLLFVPGEREHLRIGYRIEDGAPAPLRELLARTLDRVQVRRRDA